jgi:hypothetical protein
MTFPKKLLYIITISVVLIGFAGYHFIKAYDESTWFPPETGSVPPQNNVAIPINTGSSSQVKTGNLGIGNTLGLFGDKPVVAFVNSNPAVPRWIQSAVVSGTGASTLKFLYDRDNDGSVWDNAKAILQLNSGSKPSDDYAVFTNQVWATEYCDHNGDNCIDPANPATTEVDLSAIHTYSTQNNTRNVSGATCSCSAGDFLTGCGGNGSPMITTDPNACSAATSCTCLSTKPSQGLCTVTIASSIVGTKSSDTSNQKIIQVNAGDKIVLGVWTSALYPSTPQNVHFTGGDLSYALQVDTHGAILDNSHTYTHMALGYWKATDYQTYGAAFINEFVNQNNPDYKWGYLSSVTIKPGMAPRTLHIRNGLTQDTPFFANGIHPHDGTITATVGSCQ